MGPYLEFGPSSDAFGLALSGLGVVLLVVSCSGRARALVERVPSPHLVAGLALGAALLSAAYVAYFLRGGPRIVDATSYYLEARALAEGKLAFEVPSPTAAFRGRFLLFGAEGLSVIFPPGYPALLALGFLAGAPLAVGPLLAGLLVAVTFVLGRELLGRDDAGRAAALVSALCAALRYHTADTMSHGLSALLLAGVLAAAARPNLRRAGVAGFAGGWLLATRPVTGVIGIALGAALVLLRSGSRRERLLGMLAFTAALTPGIALLLLHQRAATGSLFGSTQLAYYQVADGPPGCFRWGFGDNIGCRFEHGDFVKSELAHGFGLLEAGWITLQRLGLHTVDVANLAPLALLIPWAAWRFRRAPGVRWLALGSALTVLGYLPFYYPGSYPGGGARFYADILPLEHALLGLALVELRGVRFAPAALLLGFTLHSVHAHLALAHREGGRPMFEPSVTRQAGVDRGLVFVDTDHGFSLGHDPAVRDPHSGVLVARTTGDARDFALWDRLGRPPAYLYRYSSESGSAAVHPYTPAAPRWRLESEAEWPPLQVSAGWAHPDYRPCLSRGRGLHLRPAPDASLDLEIVAPSAGEYTVHIGWLADPGAEVQVRIGTHETRATHAAPSGCVRSELGTFSLESVTRTRIRTAHTLLVDYLDLTRVDSKKR
jgi:hypothetical protein